MHWYLYMSKYSDTSSSKYINTIINKCINALHNIASPLQRNAYRSNTYHDSGP